MMKGNMSSWAKAAPPKIQAKQPVGQAKQPVGQAKQPTGQVKHSTKQVNTKPQQALVSPKNTIIPVHSVVAEFKGGLGNRIFMALAASHYAKQTGRDFVLVPALTFDNAHESKKDTDAALRKLFPHMKTHIGKHDNWAVHIDPNKNAFEYAVVPDYKNNSVIFRGYFQSQRYFPEQAPLIYSQKYEDTFFLHIRLGDYVGSVHEVDLKNYYNDALSRIKSSIEQPKLLIFSDQPLKAEDYIKKYLNMDNTSYTHSKAVDAYDCLVEMASCVGGICANSSLSWMGAYFQRPQQDAHIYMPSPWSKGEHLGIPIDLYPEWAIKLPA
jgi:hypothetical protein